MKLDMLWWRPLGPQPKRCTRYQWFLVGSAPWDTPFNFRTEDRYLKSRQELLEKIDVLLGGRSAERVIFGEITTGAQNDLQRATEIAKSMVALYGMSEALGRSNLSEYSESVHAAEPFPRQRMQ